MKTINTKEELKNLDGTTIRVTSGEALANILISEDTPNKMKNYILAQKFYSESSLELDDADFSIVKKSVETNKVYNNLVSGQLLVFLDQIK